MPWNRDYKIKKIYFVFLHPLMLGLSEFQYEKNHCERNVRHFGRVNIVF
jgi:hypothetical protein